jgi:hypothetical protein
MDPLSLIAMASTTFKGIQTLVNKGAEIEHVAQKLGAWYSYAADIKQAEQEAENPGVFKKLFDGDTVEQQALNSIIATRRLEEQEAEIRELIMYRFGAETYKEMILLRRKIKKQREEAIYRQRRRRRMIIECSAGLVAALFCGGIIWGVISLIRGAT